MPDYIQIQSRDYWVKDSVWALIEPADDGVVRLYFINETFDEDETSEIFDELTFPSTETALEALRRNRFCRYAEETSMQESVFFRPPSPPFRRTTLHPNLLCSIFWTDIPVSEANILQKITTILKNPKFELEGAFTSGVRGRADPKYSAVRAERLRGLVKKGLLEEKMFSLAELMADSFDRKDGAEADPRISWRVTARHGDYYIHIMALDQGLSRFACCLQTSAEFENALGSHHSSFPGTRYEAGNLAEIENILDEIYAYFKRQDEHRREQDEQRRVQDRIDAIKKERKILQERMASAERKKTKLICIMVCIFVAVLIAYASSQELISGETGFGLIFITIMLVVVWYDFNEQEKKNREISRAVDEENERKAQAEERYRIYQENYQREDRAIKKRVLDELKAIARGEKRRLDPEALNAAKALQARQGEHPKTLQAWAPVMDDLRAETIKDADAIKRRLNELLYPDNLEDLEALKKRQVDALNKLASGGRPDREETLEVGKALREHYEIGRLQREQELAEAKREREKEEKKDKRFRASMEEMMRSSLRMHGLPEDMPLEEALIHMRARRLVRELEKKPVEERERFLRELENDANEASEKKK